VKCPIIVYNIPARTGIDLTADTLARIAQTAPNVVATKEATATSFARRRSFAPWAIA